ncbi:phospholipase D family protein [Aliidiomarina minuta]|uniref:phospholipase D family protein n=1 Tax=Aliidiomarina minuta TaxID=880057 RepID=UPI001F545934|nr:phospholipase D family protein [Aliidiomarina minuta]
MSQSLSAAEAANTAIGDTVAPLLQEHAGKSGVLNLAEAKDAFAARLLLAGAAEQTLDVQYYLWRDDKTGLLLMQALYAAAERGVRVRLLLDDLNTSPIDNKLAALDQHSNIEVRLFNPFINRSNRVWGFISDFPRANRRMHNKSFTADSSATIVGGRNVGDDYFSGADGVLFADLDVLAIGPVVKQVATDFDLFWASPSSYPAREFQRQPDVDEYEYSMQLIHSRQEETVTYLAAVRDRELFRKLLNGGVQLNWAITKMVSDSPAKGLGKASPEQLITHELQEIIGDPTRSVQLVSPYFVPTQAGVNALVAMARQGVEISILTNSLQATDVAIVHAGYAKWRKPLLEAGIRLYEMRPGIVAPEPDENRLPRFASAATSLHAKTFAIDGERVFIGSFNFDPRSAELNTELGFVIESKELAEETARIFAEEVPKQAYELRLSASGRMYWLERNTGQHVRHDREPGTSFGQRLSVRFFSWLPIDWLL